MHCFIWRVEGQMALAFSSMEGVCHSAEVLWRLVCVLGNTFPSSSSTSAVSLLLWDVKHQAELNGPVILTWNVRGFQRLQRSMKWSWGSSPECVDVLRKLHDPSNDIRRLYQCSRLLSSDVSRTKLQKWFLSFCPLCFSTALAQVWL